jgi:hypothetical protein
MVLLLLKNEADCLARQQWQDDSLEYSPMQRRIVAARAAWSSVLDRGDDIRDKPDHGLDVPHRGV